MSRLLLFVVGITWVLSSATATRADDEAEAVEHFKKLPLAKLVRDEKQPHKPVVGLSCWIPPGKMLIDQDTFWKSVSKLSNLKQLVVCSPLDSPFEITEEGLKELASLRQLTHLYLLNAKCSDEVWKSLGELHGLTTLGLNGTHVTPTGLKEIARLKTLDTLYLGGELPTAVQNELLNTGDTAAWLLVRAAAATEDEQRKQRKDFLAKFPSRTEFVDLDLKLIAPLKKLRTLGFPSVVNRKSLLELQNVNLLHLLPQCTGEEGKRPAKLDEIIAIDLHGSELVDTDLKELAGLTKLRSLNLRDTKVTDKGLQELKVFVDLESLDLSGTAVTDAWVKELAALRKLTTVVPATVTDATLVTAAKADRLHVLSFALTKHDDRPLGAAWVTTLDLSKTSVKGEGLKELWALVNLETIKLPGELTDEMLAGLGRAKLLHTLPEAQADGGKRATKAEEVTLLDLRKSAITFDGLKQVTRFKNLSSLMLPGKFTDETLAALQQNKLLHLHIFATAAGGKRPTKPDDVIAFRLRGTDVTDAGLQELKDLTNLESLDLSDTRITDGWVREMEPFKKLTTVRPPRVTEATIAAARKAKLLPVLSQTESLTLTGKITDELLAGLREGGMFHLLPRATAKNGKPATKPEEVTSLYLTSSKVTDAGLKELVALANLTTLSLVETDVTDAGLKELAALKELTTVFLFKTKVTDAGVMELQKALPKCKIER